MDAGTSFITRFTDVWQVGDGPKGQSEENNRNLLVARRAAPAAAVCLVTYVDHDLIIELEPTTCDRFSLENSSRESRVFSPKKPRTQTCVWTCAASGKRTLRSQRISHHFSFCSSGFRSVALTRPATDCNRWNHCPFHRPIPVLAGRFELATSRILGAAAARGISPQSPNRNIPHINMPAMAARQPCTFRQLQSDNSFKSCAPGNLLPSSAATPQSPNVRRCNLMKQPKCFDYLRRAVFPPSKMAAVD